MAPEVAPPVRAVRARARQELGVGVGQQLARPEITPEKEMAPERRLGLG